MMLLYSVILQIPPTPTAMPPPPAPPGGLGFEIKPIWSFADDAVGMWNRFGETPPQVIQIAIIVMIVFVSLMLLIKWVRSISKPEGADGATS